MLKYLRMGNKRTKLIWWALVVVTVFTFVGGFIFLFGSGLDSGYQAQVSGAIGVVNGAHITRADLQNAVAEQQLAYRQRFKTEPGEQESQMIEGQAWRGLVNQRLLEARARSVGLKAHDREVVVTLQTSPPNLLLAIPDFQTEGKFDEKKYAAALQNPNINWAPFEELVRQQLPVRKLQERVIASIKLSQPELQRAFQERFERASLTLVTVPAAVGGTVAQPSEADMDRVYQRMKGLFNGPERVRLEILSLPKQFSEEERRVAKEQAQNLVDRARRGEDFAQLARDYSEGPGAEQGGVLQRVFSLAEFGPELAAQLAGMNPGDISDPITEPGRFVIVKCLERVPEPTSPVPGLRMAQIVINLRPAEQTMRDQQDAARQLRDRAKRGGLAKAATEKGLTTTRTSFFTFGSAPPQLYEAPQVADWAFSAKVGELSSLIETGDGFILAELAERREAGPAPKEDLIEQLRQLAQADARLALARPQADRVVQGASGGQSLEKAAAAAGLTAEKVSAMGRLQPDPRMAAAPDAVGAAFGAPIGKVVGPFQTPTGWVVFRVDQRTAADTTAFNQIKGQVSSDILTRKQQEFMQSWLADMRRGAKIQDLRTP